MAQFLARDSEARGALLDWWEGDALEADAQVMCEVDEVVLFVDGEEVVAQLGPGRHSLQAPPPGLEGHLGGKDLAVAFITTTAVKLEIEGQLAGPDEDEDEDEDEEEDDDADDLDHGFSCLASLRVTDPAKLLTLLEKLDEEESLEGWLADELVLQVQAVVAESDWSAEDAGEHTGEIAEQTRTNAGETLAEYGLEVRDLTDFAVLEPDDD